MPPALSDSDSDPDIIPSGTKKKGTAPSDQASDRAPEAVMAAPDVNTEEEQEEVEDEEEEDGEEGEEEYVVEAIEDHKYDGETLLLRVKWKGYEKQSDRTWEPEENCEGANEVVQEYYASIGGRPKKSSPRPPASNKRGRPSAGGAGTPSTARATKKSRASTTSKTEESPVPDREEWKPPKGSWEKDVRHVDTVEKNDAGKLVCFIQWENNNKSQHDIEIVYQKCPQKMLKFYEQHLVFKETSTGS